MIIHTILEYRGYEEKEYNFNGRHGLTRLASFLDSYTLQVYQLDVSEDYAAEFKSLNLEKRKEYEVTLAMTAQPQITNDNSFGRDRFVLSSRNFICKFEIKDIIPFSNTILPDSGTGMSAVADSVAAADVKKGSK